MAETDASAECDADDWMDEDDMEEFFTPPEALNHSSSQPAAAYWGRLYPAGFNVKVHNLIGNEVTVGKLPTCHVTISSSDVPIEVLTVVSRQHFIIRRTQQERFGIVTCKIILEDVSTNGTFINDHRVGRGRIRTLPDNSVIAVGECENKIFYFKNASDGLVDNKLPREVNNNYHIGVKLGSGTYGEVFLAFHKESGKGYAMKTIIKKPTGSNRKAITTLDNEIKILRKIDHPNVIRLANDVDSSVQKYLFLELMRGKDLFFRIHEKNLDCTTLTESQSKLYFYQIASGVRYLHSNGIVHRDLKPENVLLATEEVDTIVKITDFGLSKVVDSKTYVRTMCGTKAYVAPEILESRGSKKYSAQVDVWSMGVILFVCLSGETPFGSDRKGYTIEEQIKNGIYSMKKEKWQTISVHAKKIIKKMMTTNPVHRITISAILDDSWLKDQIMLSKVQHMLSQAESSPARKRRRIT